MERGEEQTPPEFSSKLFIHFTLNNKFYSHLTVCAFFSFSFQLIYERVIKYNEILNKWIRVNKTIRGIK